MAQDTTALLAQFRVRFPELSEVDDARVSYWIEEGGDFANWPDSHRDTANILYAAHRIAESQQNSEMPSGVISFKSGTFSASIDAETANRTGFEATLYGRQYLELVRAAFSGPRPAWTPPCS